MSAEMEMLLRRFCETGNVGDRQALMQACRWALNRISELKATIRSMETSADMKTDGDSDRRLLDGPDLTHAKSASTQAASSQQAAPQCYTCVHRQQWPGNAHIQCLNPDPNMTADRRAIDRGWAYYPFIFDPVWLRRKCANYRSVDENVSVKKDG